MFRPKGLLSGEVRTKYGMKVLLILKDEYVLHIFENNKCLHFPFCTKVA